MPYHRISYHIILMSDFHITSHDSAGSHRQSEKMPMARVDDQRALDLAPARCSLLLPMSFVRFVLMSEHGFKDMQMQVFLV